jgi:hypothetical protein
MEPANDAGGFYKPRPKGGASPQGLDGGGPEGGERSGQGRISFSGATLGVAALYKKEHHGTGNNRRNDRPIPDRDP